MDKGQARRGANQPERGTLTKGGPKHHKPGETHQELLDGLRDAYLAYKESAGRRKPVLKPRKAPGAGAKATGTTSITDARDEQQFRDFYFAAPIPLLDEPEKQKRFRGEFLEEVGARPEPEPVAYLADTLHLEALKVVADHSKPSTTRQDLAAFFRRHAVALQHKKYRMLGRWADQVTTSRQVDMTADQFDRMVGRLQKEFDSAIQRTERLAVDDAYDYAVDPEGKRPQPTSGEADGGRSGTLLYVEAPERSVNSVVRLDDVEVYLRLQSYRSRLYRLPEKLAVAIRWLPYSRRFDIWERSRLMMHGAEPGRRTGPGSGGQQEDDCRGRQLKRERLLRAVDEFARAQLCVLGVAEDKQLNTMAEKYTRHLQPGEFGSYQQQATTGHRALEERPPFLCTSNLELKEYLVPLAEESGLPLADAGDQDDGAQAAYYVETQFPCRFEKQAFALQFDWIDSGELTQADTDILLIQKLTQELNLDKNEMLQQMAKQAETERKKSILGQIGKKDQLQADGDQGGSKKKADDGQGPAEDIARMNLVRRIKEMEFFTLDETQCKLKRADWLQHVCWLPAVDDAVKRQNHHLSSIEENPIDSLLLSAFEFVDVNENGAANKILEDSASAHVSKVKAYFTEISQPVEKQARDDPHDTVELILRHTALGEDASKNGEGSQRSLDLGLKGQAFIEKHLQAIDPLKPRLIKSYYSLRLLKQRGIKAQLIQAMNYFRAVQKRLAFDVREFFTRERALGGQKVEEALIGPQFGKDEQGNLKAKQGGSAGPGGINATRLTRQMDDGSHLSLVDGEPRADPVSLKGYKYNKQFNPRLTSTCPCVPRFHTTFGRPTLYEEVSQRVERWENDLGRWKSEANPLPACKDKIMFTEGANSLLESEFMVRDEHGIQIVYEEALNDMLLLEEELIKIGSYFLNKAEMSQHACGGERQSSMLDRGEVALHLLQHEFEFQAMKAKHIEGLLDAYNHVCDPLESVRILQVIADTMALRPRIDLEAAYFRDGYIAEREVLREKQLLFSEMLGFLKADERVANENARRFQELKVRKLADFVHGKWTYRRDAKRVERIGTREEQERGQAQEEAVQGRRAQQLREMKKQQALKEIAERHITEFAGDQHTDFAKVLGLPEVTAADLFKKQGQQDPLVVDAIREQCNFSKQTEGYPWYFVGAAHLADSLGLHTEDVGLTDFYESLCAVTRVHAACEQASGELSYIFRPENGMAASCLDRAMLQEARGLLRVLRSPVEEGGHDRNKNSESNKEPEDNTKTHTKYRTKSASQLEEDFYLGSSDKLVFLMREFKQELNPDHMAATASPLLVAKLDVKEVAKFDFPRIKLTEAEGYDELSDEKLTERMIEMAKLSITRKRQDQKQEDTFAMPSSPRETSEVDGRVQSPSMMVMACNILEVLRLREELVRAVHEADLLARVYSQQLTLCAKQAEALRLRGNNAFDTSSISGENSNLVDANDGTKMEVDLAFMEFDSSLRAQLDFRSESCIKALTTNLGVEELRAVMRYQLMQKQLLSAAVMRNQALMDGPQQGLQELALLNEHKVTVPGSMLDVKELFQRGLDGPGRKTARGSTYMTTNLSKEVGPHLLSVAAVKNRHRPTATKKWMPIYQRVASSERSTEAKLRILRATRLVLLHEFCSDVLQELYGESLAIQTLHNCRELRRKAALFPKDARPLILGQGGVMEHLPYTLSEHMMQGEAASSLENEARPSLSGLLKGRPKTLLYIPSSNEIMEHARTAAQEYQAAAPQSSTLAGFDEDTIDDLVLSKSQQPTICAAPEDKAQPQGRHVGFKEVYDYSKTQTNILQFTSILLQILSLEYLMGRNHSPGAQVLALEDSVAAGTAPWTGDPAKAALEKPEDSAALRNATKRVIANIMKKKRAQVDLAEDIREITKRLVKIDEFLQTTNADQLRLPFLLDLLRMQHQTCYLQMMNGLEHALDIYLDHNSQENFAKVQEVQGILARRDQGFNLLGNGHYLNQGSKEAKEIDATSPLLQDHDEFLKCYQPMVDETALIPSQLTLVRRLYGRTSRQRTRAQPAVLSQALPNYGRMACSFFNMDDEQRSFLATNFHQLDEGLEEYLIFEGLIEDKNRAAATSDEEGRSGQQAVHIARPKDILQGKIEYLSLKVEARHLQRVLMSWTICSALPTTIEGYNRAQQLCREQTMLKVLLERDQLIEQYYEKHKPPANARQREGGAEKGGAGGAAQKLKQEHTTVLESVNPQSREHTIVSKLSQTKAEITVAGRVLDIEMIKMSRAVIDREQAALFAAFEEGAAEDRVHYFVHPQQQFASTLFQSVDKDSHLDVVNKLGFVQTFLTKLRNRCTEVETLAGGPGIVFSLNDFNECLHAFCQSLLKYSETELRSRVETQHIRENQYQHLLYMKEKQALYFRRKCEQFLDNIDKLVNAKISQKGSQLIYELDVASRELRVLRDNYRLMQGIMMRELRDEYERAIKERQNRADTLRKDYDDHKKKVYDEEITAVTEEFNKLTEKIKTYIQEKIPADGELPRADLMNMMNSAMAGLRGGPGQAKRAGQRGVLDYQPAVEEAVFDAEPRREVLDLQAYIQKRRVLTLMKQVLADERQEKELANQRAQLTSNAALWDQLAEAEKREQITKQELTLTKLSLASYEKLIEKLQGELENLNNQKARLQQYKNSKSKRIEELENKMKDLEILENIDLNRILTELKSRDRKIEQLSAVDRAGKGSALHAVRQQSQKEVHDLKGRLLREREMKLQAYDRLEGLRVEMRALEGKDVKSDLWKDKCRELFDICKDLETENEDLKALVGDANRANLLTSHHYKNVDAGQGGAINMYQGGYPIDLAVSAGTASIGAQSSGPQIKSGERLFTSRTLAAVGGARARGYGRLASGTGVGQSYPLGTTPLSNQPATLGVHDADGYSSSFAGMMQRKRGAPQSGWQNKDTVHSENMPSYNVSAAAGHPLDQQLGAAQELLSLGSGGPPAEHSTTSGLQGDRRSLAPAAGGVFSGTLQSFQQARPVMTAHGGARGTVGVNQMNPMAGNRVYGSAYGGPRARPGPQGPAGSKRLTSQEPSSGKNTGLPGVRARPQQARNFAASSGRPSQTNPVGLQPRGGAPLSSQNHSQASGMNVQGRGAGLPTSSGQYRQIPTGHLSAEGVGIGQPMGQWQGQPNVNVNVTNIKVNKQ